MNIRVEKTGGIWHAYLEWHPEVDERALTEEIARRKVERIVEKMGLRVAEQKE
jgi:glutamate dehydrogenase/leucine dehydrogenase